MIILNGKKQEISLVAIAPEKATKFISKDSGAITFISEDKTAYLVMAKSTENKLKKVVVSLKAFIASNKFNVNIDLDSFFQIIGKDFSKEEIFNAITEAIDFASHKLVSYKKCADGGCKKELPIYNIITKEDFKQNFEKQEIKNEFINFARDLQDTPPNIATSIYIADKIAEKAKEIKNVKVTVLDKKAIEKLGMGLLLSVNAGSEVEPRVVILEYVGDSSSPKTALIGKGITFDSGGYNLKPSNFMTGMKFDMSGSVIMPSTVMALAKAKAKTNVMSVSLLTDNRIGGHATLPESIITSMNGLTVEIGNTDAEGRLVLADGMTYAVREKQADRLIDASTLTGAIGIALGHWATGVFTHDNKMWNELEKVSKFTGERFWRLPIYPEHLEVMKRASKLADLNNSEAGREAGSSTAAAFLNEFAEGKPYVHLDIASTASAGERGTGVLVKTLFEYLNK